MMEENRKLATSYPITSHSKNMEIIKKVKQLSRTQQGVSLTQEDREILNVEEGSIVEVRKHKSHKEFVEEVREANSLPAKTCRALGPESEEDIAMYAEDIE